MRFFQPLLININSVSGSISPPKDKALQGVLDQFDPLSLNAKEGQKPLNNNSKEAPSTISAKDASTSQTENEKLDQRRDSATDDEEPFDFLRFVEQLKHKSADPIARYLKTFLSKFSQSHYTAEEQVKIINKFKSFIAERMEEYPPFSTLSEVQMDNALEGMEKLIMNRLYTKTFSPEMPANKSTDDHEEDILRDRVLDDKISIWHWVEGRHLDIPNWFLRNGEAFVNLASDQLSKLNQFRAPRDKVICLLNCCKVIFGLLRQSKSEENADSFLPILIYVVIKAHPSHLISNLNYIQRFRNPDKLNGEAGYYLSSLHGAVSFIETLDRSNLSISDEEFNEKVDESVKTMASKTQSMAAASKNSKNPPHTPTDSRTPERTESPSDSAIKRRGTPVASGSLTPSAILQNSAGIFTAPLKSLGRFFESDPALQDSTPQTEQSDPVSTDTPTPPSVPSTDKPKPKTNDGLSPEELAAQQISVEEQEAQRISRLEFENVVQTLSQMFPGLDKEVITDVVTEKQGRVGAAVDTCLALVGDQ